MTDIRPQPGRQEDFLSCDADIVIYGGAAGGGKTFGLLLDPLRDRDVDGFNAVIFRRTYPEVTNAGGLWDESARLYPHAGGTPIQGDLLWRFPTGARIEFGHCEYEANLYRWDGAQICDLCFDQLEHFTEKQFFYLLARNRSTCGVVPRVRATCNPDPESWLVEFLSWWIADDGYANLDRAGLIRWFIRVNDKLVWADTKEQLIERYPDNSPKSITFIPATIYDNRILLAKDPGYLANLKALPLVERERFLGDAQRGGNWKIKPGESKVFNRDWFKIVSSVPSGGIECRGWDLAATERSVASPDPDYNAGVKIRKVGNQYYVVDVVLERLPAGEVDSFVGSVTGRDVTLAQAVGTKLYIRWETEPGSAGIREADRMKRELRREYPGINCDGVASTGDKLQRAQGFAAACEHGYVFVLAAPWTEQYLSQLHAFPSKRIHDDLVDGSSSAYNTLQPLSDVMNNNAPRQQVQRSPMRR